MKSEFVYTEYIDYIDYNNRTKKIIELKNNYYVYDVSANSKKMISGDYDSFISLLLILDQDAKEIIGINGPMFILLQNELIHIPEGQLENVKKLITNFYNKN